jgi:hypothetical protein
VRIMLILCPRKLRSLDNFCFFSNGAGAKSEIAIAIANASEQCRHRCCLYQKSDSAIMVMKPAEDGHRYDAAHVPTPRRVSPSACQADAEAQAERGLFN